MSRSHRPGSQGIEKSDFSHYQKVTLVMPCHDFRLLTLCLAWARLAALQ
jgi:hypothetical protein